MNNYFAFVVLLFVFLLGMAGVALHSHLALTESSQETFDWVAKVSLGALLSLVLRPPTRQPVDNHGQDNVGR